MKNIFNFFKKNRTELNVHIFNEENIYFKAINFFNLEYLNYSSKCFPEDSKEHLDNLNDSIYRENFDMKRMFENHNNYQIENKYIEEPLFFSNQDLNKIKFNIFKTSIITFSKSVYFKTPDKVQSYFWEKYKIAFLIDLDKEKKYSKHNLNYQDFINVILPNLSLELIQIFDLKKINKNRIIYNWGFFEENENFNAFYENFSQIPYKPLDNPKTIDCNTIALRNILKIAQSTVDTAYKGHHIKNLKNYNTEVRRNLLYKEIYDIEDLQPQSTTEVDFRLKVINSDITEIINSLKKKNILEKELEVLLNLFKTKPFEIIKAPNTV